MSKYNPSTTASDFTIDDGELNDFATYNNIFHKLLENDKYIYGSFGEIPGVWFCKWFNDDREPGYNRGDFFWLNTQDISKWMKDNSETMQEYINRNPYVSIKLPAWKSNDEEVYNLYYAALTGYKDDKMACPLSALYELGHLSARFQLVISQKDNNKDAIDTLSSWKRFVVNTSSDYEDIMTAIDSQVISSLAKHVQMYHFGNDILTDDIRNSLSDYLDDDFSNAKYAWPRNFLINDGECEGLDVVDVYLRKPINPRTTNGLMEEYVWFRKWKSGFLEHGGLINITLSNYLNKSTGYVQIPFNWKLLDGSTRAYKVSYLGDKSKQQIEVDETKEIPPGDNRVSVIYELSSLKIDGSDLAPIFSNTNYVVTITPVTPTYLGAGDTSPTNVSPYANIGNFHGGQNTVTHTIEYDQLNKAWFRFKYTSQNTPKFYYYHAAGFIREEKNYG